MKSGKRDTQQVVWRLLLACALLLPASSVFSTAWGACALLDVCSWSNLVVVGTVSSRKAVMERDGHGQVIYTYVTMGIERVVRGPPTIETVTLRVTGGTVGDTTLMFTEGPRFDRKGHYLLFLRTDADAEYPLIIEHRFAPSSESVPSSKALSRIWEAVCSAYPDGLPPGSLTFEQFSDAAASGGLLPGPQQRVEEQNNGPKAGQLEPPAPKHEIPDK